MVKVTLKTTLTNTQNKHPPGTRKPRLLPSPAYYPFFLRRSLYLRQMKGAARIRTFLNTPPTGSSYARGISSRTRA